MVSLVVHKLIAIGLMAVITFAVGIVPIPLLTCLRQRAAAGGGGASRKRWPSLTLCLLTCFSAGVFLGSCFLHLLPETLEQFDYLKSVMEWKDVSYPFSGLLVIMGFLFIWALEEMFLMLLPHGHSHGGSANAAVHMDSGEQSHGHSPPPITDCAAACVDVEQKTTNLDGHECTHEHEESRSALLATCEERAVSNGRGNSRGNAKHDHSPPSCNGGAPDAVGFLPVQAGGQRHGSFSAGANRGAPQPPAPVSAVTSRPASPDLPPGSVLAEPECCEIDTCEGVDEAPPILMQSRPHAHSHGVRSIAFVIAVALHSVIEGLALGVQGDAASTWTMWTALMVHKVIVAFSVGLQLGRTHAHALKWVALAIAILAITSPFGAAVGIALENAASLNPRLKEFVVFVMQGTAVGTFLYVTFFEVLLHERDNEHPNMLKVLMVAVGVLVLAALRAAVPHAHSHGAEAAADAHGGGGNWTAHVLAAAASAAGGHGHSHEH